MVLTYGSSVPAWKTNKKLHSRGRLQQSFFCFDSFPSFLGVRPSRNLLKLFVHVIDTLFYAMEQVQKELRRIQQHYRNNISQLCGY